MISWISKKVQEIAEDAARALDDKDLERPGSYDALCNKLACCSGCPWSMLARKTFGATESSMFDAVLYQHLA